MKYKWKRRTKDVTSDTPNKLNAGYCGFCQIIFQFAEIFTHSIYTATVHWAFH